MKSTLKRLLRDKATPLLVILIVLMLFTMVMSSGVLDGAPISAMFTEGFMARVNILSNFYNLVIQIFMLVGLSCILISGNIDLSIAGQAMLGSLIFAKICADTALPWGIAFLITMVVAVVFGLINTVMVNYLRFPAFIATIGASSIYSGLCNVITGGNNIQIARESFLQIGKTVYFGVLPLTFVMAIIVLVVFQFVLTKTTFGRSLFMAGGNPTAARLCGLNSNRMRMIMFIVNSVLSVLGGILYASQLCLASPTNLVTSAPNMTATSAAILGGVAFTGGAGNLVGPLIALVLINVFENMLGVLGVGSYWVVFAQGVLLLLALIIDYVSANRREKAMLKSAMEN
ncbi:MAG: ABC transporter permease [Oscillospiraceae bacterium]|nr:ABC transporter permease [Oscillospiraceae bacterium]